MYVGISRFTLAVAGLSMSLVFAQAALAANGANTVSVSDYEHKGFLSDYSNLAPQANVADSKATVYRNEKVDWTRYDSIFLEDIEIHYELPAVEDSADNTVDFGEDLGDQQPEQVQRVDADDLKALKAYLRKAITKELGQDFQLVTEPASGALRLRIAITELEPTKTEVSMAVTAIPFGSVADFAAGGGTGTASYLGAAAIEAEFVDSGSNEQLAAYVEKRAGRKYNIDLGKGIDTAIGDGLSSYMGAYSEWAYVEDALDHWARALRLSLDGMQPGQVVETAQNNTVENTFFTF